MLTWNVANQYNGLDTIDQSSAATGYFNPIINLKTAGTRVVTPTGITGEQTGDTLSSPASTASMAGTTTPYLGTSITGKTAAECPVVEVTWQTSR